MNYKTEETIKLLEDLVTFPVLGGQSNLTIAEYLKQYLETNGIDYHLVPNEERNKVSIHCRIGPPVDGGVILSGHTDVVPTEGQTWTKPDFELTRENGRLYSRGSADMKGFLACCLAMVPEISKANLKKPIYLAFSYDEEVGCLAGAELACAIRDTYSERPAFAIIGEPTSMQTVTGEKGIGIYSTTITSSAAHSSAVRSNVSAIYEATYLIQWLWGKMEHLIADGKLDSRFIPPHSTLHVGTIKGGAAVNIVADHCTFDWDVRTIPSDTVEEILKAFEENCKKMITEKQKQNPGFNIVTSAQFSPVPGLDTPRDASVVQLMSQLTGSTETSTVSYASEAGQFAEAGFDAVLCGPGSIEQAHRADEYIEINQLEKCISFLNNLIDWSKK